MRRFFSAASALAIALAIPVTATSLSLPKLGFGKETPAPAVAQLLKPGEWAQAHSDVAPDPSIRFGALPNGMRYAIRKQSVPPGQAAIRMRIDAGSLMETDGQQGLAHFLEHMAFNGSKAVPEGEMIKILERLGLAFGADTNASTNFDETVYKLDLPRTNDETVDAALMLMRETAGNLTLDQGAIDRERGVVLSEERAILRPTASTRSASASSSRASGRRRAIRSARSRSCRVRPPRNWRTSTTATTGPSGPSSSPSGTSTST